MRLKAVVISTAKVVLIGGGLAALVWAYRANFTEDKPPLDDDDFKYQPVVKVHVAKVTTRPMKSSADVYGVIEPAPARPGIAAASAEVASPVTAAVASVEATEGVRVSTGDVLFHLDSRESDAALVKATSDRDAARRLAAQPAADRDRIRFDRDLAVAEAAVVRATADRDLRTIKSPIAGTVTRLTIRPGDVLTAAAPAVQVVNLDRLVAALSVPVSLLPAIKIGQKGELVTDVGPPVPCEVVFVDPAVDPATGQGSVDVSVKQHRLGQVVHVRLILDEHDAMVVPADAVVEMEDGSFAVSVTETIQRRNGVHLYGRRRPVGVGLRDGGFVEVSSPDLNPGSKVVTTGAFSLTDQCMIDVVPEKGIP